MEERKSIKDKLFYYFVDKNEYIKKDYSEYVWKKIDNGNNGRLSRWFYLIMLNIKYRIFRCKPDEGNRNPASGNRNPVAANKNARETGAKKAPKKKKSMFAEPESVHRDNPLSVHFARTTMKYDVVSFDVFDTLILRPFSSPADLFFVVGERLNLPEYKFVRQEAEQKLKRIREVTTGSREVTLEEIYDYIEDNYGLDKDKCMKTELEVELEYCYANPYIQQVYNMVKDQGKTIIIATDMYLSKDFIIQLLNKNGYDSFEKVFVSNEYKVGKNIKGNLYEYIKDSYPDKTIIHIGDNQEADIKNARKHGLDALYYQNVNKKGEAYRTKDMSNIIVSLHTGIVNNHLHNGVRTYSAGYEYGFICGGIYVLAFCRWMQKLAEQEHIDKVLFLARDGVIYKNVMDNFFPEVNNEYFLWSRIANAKYSFYVEGPRVFNGILNSYVNSVDTYHVMDFLSEYNLDSLTRFLNDYELEEGSIISAETIGPLKKLLAEHRDDIAQDYKMQMSEMEQIIRSKVGNSKRIAIVDVGWLASGPMALKKIIEDYLQLDCKVECWVAGIRSSRESNIDAMVLKGDIKAFLFSNQNNRDLFLNFTKKNVTPKYGLNYVFMEMFTQSCSPSFFGVDDDGNILFKQPEVENYNQIREIHKGILDYCHIYTNTVKNDQWLLNISGSDAYRPFRFLVENPQYFRNNFSDFSFSRVIGNGKTEVNEKLKDLF